TSGSSTLPWRSPAPAREARPRSDLDAAQAAAHLAVPCGVTPAPDTVAVVADPAAERPALVDDRQRRGPRPTVDARSLTRRRHGVTPLCPNAPVVVARDRTTDLASRGGPPEASERAPVFLSRRAERLAVRDMAPPGTVRCGSF